MHARLAEENEPDPLDVFCDLGTLILEARVPGRGDSGRGYGEGPHCPPYFSHAQLSSNTNNNNNNNHHNNNGSRPGQHVCSPDKLHCQRFQHLRKHASLLGKNGVPLCVEVLVGPECCHGSQRAKQVEVTCTPDPDFLLLERWTVTCSPKKDGEASIAGICLVQAVRSFLHFSQLSAWLNKSSGSRPQQLLYRVTMPGQAFASKFASKPVEHHFPLAHVGRLATHAIKVSVSSLPRTDVIPHVHCGKCRFITPKQNADVGQRQLQPKQDSSSCLGEGLLDMPPAQLRLQRLQRSRSRSSSPSFGSIRLLHPAYRAPPQPPSNGSTKKLLDDRMRIDCNRIGKHDCKCGKEDVDVVDLKLPAGHGDRWGHDLERGRRGLDREPGPTERGRSRRSRKDCFADKLLIEAESKEPEMAPVLQAGKNVPTTDDKLRFQRSLNSAASLLFHTTTCTSGTDSKTPRLGQRFPLNKFLRSPPLRMSSSPLLGSFEECLLNGRLEPMSTVEGFGAELGASGSFCPSHELLPVSVFFYNIGGLGESDKSASPYLAHLNLGAKGYQVPRRGTVQLTLFNPQGTVVKMFVILFDLTEMPPNSETFLRQRTFFMPSHETDASPVSAKWLRYLIHLRFRSSKSGRIHLHTDIRMIVLRKSDVDTASAHIAESSYEWKSFTRGPSSPRFSSR
ncbi:atos homolog protein A-like [Daphnia carinata]|uniref:atos homolog protein A-like n=1 Tax=Daphnia carinata TaxID=120202 RepID=UPI00257DB612|nr:atos homolog protein A-like [Daphnia carinata]XP_059350148.1 atos homolog protein A-like [Daphnia carinata]